MSTDRVSSSYNRATYSREPQQREEVRNQSPEPANRTPEQARNEAITRKPRQAVRTLGNKIDIYA